MSKTRAFIADQVKLTPSRLGPKVGGVVGAAVTLAGAIVSSSGASAVVLAIGLAILSLSLLVSSIRPTTHPRTQLLVDGDELVVGGGEPPVTFRLRELSMGWNEGPLAIVVTGDGGRVEARLESAEVAERFVEALGLDAARRTLTLPLRGQIGKGTWTFVGAFLGLFLGGVLGNVLPVRGWEFWIMVSSMLVTAWGLRQLGAPRVTIGVDGVRMRGLGARFIPYRDIVKVDVGAPPFESSDVRLALRGGGAALLPVVGQSQAAIDAMVRRIEAGMRVATGSSDDLAELARGGRDLATWRRDLTELARPTQDFRTRRVDVEQLERILRDPGVPPERRIGAALALMPTQPELAKTHVRAAALASADDRVRVAFEAAAEETLEEEHLAALEAADDEPARTLRG